MRKAAARALLGYFEKRYDYDTTYMKEMLAHSPGAFFKFARIMGAAGHREAAPKEAYYAAKLVGALVEDCGPCTQLVVNMAREAKVDPGQVKAVLERRTEAMSEATALGFRFAEAIAHHLPDADDAREAVRAAWGEKGLIDLAMGMQIGRVFPMLKLALGHAKTCRRVAVDGRDVDVAKRAA